MSVKSQGCAIALGTSASPIVYTDIATTSIGGPSGARAIIDATTLGDVAKIKDVGLPDYGQVNCDFNFDQSELALIDTWDAFKAGTLQNFTITFSDSPASVLTFTGYPMNVSFNIGLDDIVRGTFTIEISGDVEDNWT